VNLPWTHRIVFTLASSGWRGSQFFWRIARGLQKVKEGTTVKLPNNFPLQIDSKDWISKTVYEGTYERALLKFLNSLALKECSIDVGANIGVTLWHGLKHSEPSATFVAFEPSAQCINALRNTCANLINSGEIYDFAIGAADESRSIYGLGNQLHSGAASLISHAGLRGEEGEVQVRKFDSVFQEYLESNSISLLKIDTEGYEAEVINGASKSIPKGKIEVIILEVSPNFGSVDYLKYLNLLLEEKYRWFAIKERGNLKRSTYLNEVSLNQALAFDQQWNLVLMRKDVFERYKWSKSSILVRELD
jgi:FkbM family methyltransferase